MNKALAKLSLLKLIEKMKISKLSRKERRGEIKGGDEEEKSVDGLCLQELEEWNS